ncbi:unnamed protein product [Acanthoscelides obtectus]|uniref:Uncharacterized protein n=1 Tax=Acanthoscelides obtectus TaxID=200917 RepID=A0A9P0KSH4_ACAOB|nr:unnamed protein product [Acanthoscelides obtectus]CAK1675853.1 hypothetical protein AOBTE_LOCUS30446 [Acanthoscelides obtectus]
MDFLTSEQLRQYQDIIDQINSAFAEKDRLKKELDTINNKIILQNLTTSRAVDKIAHVILRIFSKASDVLKLYEDEISSDTMFNSENCKYYIVEVYLTNAVLQKLCVEEWLLNISISYKNTFISKTVNLRSTVPIIELIPIDENIIESTLQVTLLPKDNKQSIVNLDKQHIDISYHFEMYKKNRQKTTVIQKILQIGKLYNENNELRKLLNEKQEFYLECQAKTSEFKREFLNRCYHNIGIEQFSNFEDNSNDFNIQFTCKYSKAEMIVAPHEVRVRCNIIDLSLLKIYFYSLLRKYKKACVTEDKLQEIAKMKSIAENSNVNEIYSSLQKFRSKLF